MSSSDVFDPAGVLDLSDEPQFEPVTEPDVERASEPPGINGPTEEETRQAIEKEEQKERTAGAFAPNLRVSARPGQRLPPIPSHEDIGDLLEHEPAKMALRRLQATRTVLAKQLDSLQKYLGDGGVAGRLHERARELEVRSSDPVWLVIEATLDSAWRINNGLEIFAESLGVYLEYEFTKVQLYDSAIAKLEESLSANTALRAELEHVRGTLDRVQRQLLSLEGNQYEAINALPEFTQRVATHFAQALENGRSLALKTDKGIERLTALSLWLKAGVIVGTLCLGACAVLVWFLISRI
jgi:hypothetical protein